MELVSTIVCLVGEHSWRPIKRHLGYLIFYKRNIDNMEIKFGELDAKRKDVQRQVQAAYHERLEEVDSSVEAWLENVENADEDAKRIKDESTSASTNNKGFLHFCLHHRLGKQAAAQIQAIDDLLVKKGNFDRVSHSRPPPSTTGSLLVNEGYVMFESRKSCINEILNAFNDENVYVIGVYGMGGIGKTTLVKEAAKQGMNDGIFTEVVMVTVSQKMDVKKIQTGIAESLRLELNEETIQVRADKIERRLDKEGNRVLVVLDDLWEMLELSKVRIPDWNKGTCRVVITSRIEDVCNQMGCQKKVELRTLSDEESWLLFKSRAENVVESPTMKEVAWNVAKQCAGLPLALVVLGIALKGKNLEVWKIVLNQLKKSTMALDLPGVSNKVRESIELSYNFLESEAVKWCFLHCCLYPEDYDNIEEDELMHMLVGGGLLEDVESLQEAQDRVHVLMDQLKVSGLLLEDQNMKSNVRMHDVVRDVAIWIGERDHGFFVRAGKGLEEWPRNSDAKLQNCRRLSLMSNKIVDLPSDPIKCTKLETLILSGNRRLQNIPKNFFQHMGALKVLDLSRTMISCLPESLSCLTSLRVLNLKRCLRLQDISPINGMKMLEILILKDTCVSVVPEDTRGLLNLRLVDFGKESNTSISSYFSNVLRGCSRLEQLFIPKYEGCLELASLRFLTHLHISDGVVKSNESLSKDLGSSRSWTNLQECQICFLPSICNCLLFRNGYLHLERTKHFSPPLKALLKKIESLAIVYCQESEVISSKGDIPPYMFHNLTRLEVSDCLNLTSLGDEPLFQLKLMVVKNCPKLTRLLPSKLWQGMHQMKKLEVANCTVMLQLFPYDHIPMVMTELLPKLQSLELKKLPKLESVLQPFQCLPNLMELKIIDCGLRCGLAYYEMERVADPFPKLKRLEVIYCMRMLQLFPYDHKPMAMTELLPELEYLNLSELRQLESVLQPFQCLPNLVTLRIYECGLRCGLAYHEVKMAADPFPMLEKLKINKCMEMSQMISSSSPDALQDMCIFQNLRRLNVAGCQRLTHLFWSKQAKHMQQLTSLKIYDCNSLTAVVISNENQEEGESTSTIACMVVDHHGSHIFHNLTHLSVYTCPRLTHLFWSKQAKHMQQLTSLIIYDCDSLTAVVISNENQEGASASTSTSTTACAIVDHYGAHNFFPRLRKLILKRLPKIVAFHQPTTSPMDWPCLKGHVIEECSKLETPLLGPQMSKRIRVLFDQDEEDSEEKAWFL